MIAFRAQQCPFCEVNLDELRRDFIYAKQLEDEKNNFFGGKVSC